MNYLTFSHTITNPRDDFNKDAFLIKDNWFVVADGISSKGEYGAQAAQLAVTTIAQTNLEEMSSSKDLKSLFQNLSSEIRSFYGGTTLTSICIKNDNLILAHIGDSECYVIRNSQIREITKPNTIAFENFLKGIIDRKDLKTSYGSNVLLAYLGMRESFDHKNSSIPQIEKIPLKNVTHVMLCSDGANIVPSERLREIMTNEKIENPAKDIADLAAELGSKDDITVVVIKFIDVV